MKTEFPTRNVITNGGCINVVQITTEQQRANTTLASKIENRLREYQRKYLIPDYMHEGLARYVMRGIPPGDFLTAVIAHDLFRAVDHADSANRESLAAYVIVIANAAPAACHGSYQHFDDWCRAGGLCGTLGVEHTLREYLDDEND